MSNNKLQATTWPPPAPDSRRYITRSLAMGCGALLFAAGALVGHGIPSSAQTPQACIEAVNLADEVITTTADGIRSGVAGSTLGIQRATDHLNEIAPSYHEAKAKCRGE